MTVANRIWNNLIVKWPSLEDLKKLTLQNYTRFQAALEGERRSCLPESSTCQTPRYFMLTTTWIIFVPIQSPRQFILPPLPHLLPVARYFQIIEKGFDNKTSVEPLLNLEDFCQPIPLTRNWAKVKFWNSPLSTLDYCREFWNGKKRTLVNRELSQRILVVACNF